MVLSLGLSRCATMCSNHALYVTLLRIILQFSLKTRCTPCSLYFCWTLPSIHVVYSTLQGLILLFLFMCKVYSLHFVFLLDFVLRPCGVLHITEGYRLAFIYVQGVFLAVCISVGPSPQNLCYIPHYRELSYLFICRVYMKYSLYFFRTLSLDHVLYSTIQRDILLFEFVRAVNKEAFSVNFIVDRISLPY